MEVSGHTIIVTGGASGLGAASARRLAGAGATVAIFDLDRDRGAAEAAAIGGTFHQVDISSAEAVAAALDAVIARHGDVRALVHCAGVGLAAKTLSRGQPLELDRFRRVIEVNLIGTFNCVSQVAARMAATDPIGEERGAIVVTASVAAYEGQVGQVGYSASKGGIVGMVLPIARDLADKAIRIVGIAPGLFETPLLLGLPEEARVSLGRQAPFPNRLGRPEEFAQLAQSIIENPMLNGEVIRLDGALRMAPR